LIDIDQPYITRAFFAPLKLSSLILGLLEVFSTGILQNDVIFLTIFVKHHYILIFTNFISAVIWCKSSNLNHSSKVLVHPGVVQKLTRLIEHYDLAALTVSVRQQDGDAVPLVVQVPPLGGFIVVIDGFLQISCGDSLIVHLCVGV
jgi:hypothetical protein